MHMHELNTCLAASTRESSTQHTLTVFEYFVLYQVTETSDWNEWVNVKQRDKTIEKTIVNNNVENETKKFGLASLW